MADVLTAMDDGNAGVVGPANDPCNAAIRNVPVGQNIRRPYTATIRYVHVGLSTNDTVRVEQAKTHISVPVFSPFLAY